MQEYEMPEVTPELKDLLVNFVGQTYGEMHKLDREIVQSATGLQPASELLKSRASSIIRSVVPQTHREQQHHQQPQFTPASGPVIDRGMPQPVTPLANPDQLEFMFNSTNVSTLIDTLKSIDSRLKKIASSMDVIVEKLEA